MTTKRVLLDIVDTAFDLAFVTRCPHPSRDECTSIVFAKIDELWIQLGVIPVRCFDGALGVIKDDALWHSTESPERILKGANKALSVLLEDGFAVAFS